MLLRIVMIISLSSCAGLNKNTQDENYILADENVGTEPKEETPAIIDDSRLSSNRTQDEIQADDEAMRTFPLVYNEMVEMWINFFTTKRGRPTMERWLSRSTRYIPLMQQVLREEGLPEDLIYLAMIESGFNLKALSRAKAVGPWQFIKGTGERYGMKSTYWYDERSDIRKSTYAAAKYLKELHQIFGSWYLAAAAYNAGEGRVLMAVRSDRSRNFWELARKKKNFRAETRNYVPKIIAAALISKNPHKYGFVNINYQAPLAWETAQVPNGVTLNSVSQILGVDKEELSILNAELRHGITPPGETGYELRIPTGKRDLLIANINRLEIRKIGDLLEHKIRSGENISTIARKYAVSQTDIVELNKIKNVRALKIGQVLMIPTRIETSTKKRRQAQPASTALPKAPQTNAVDLKSLSLNNNEYRVQSGDTLWSIARRFNTSVNEIKRINDLKNTRSIQIGAVLKIPPAQANSSGSSSPNTKSRPSS